MVKLSKSQEEIVKRLQGVCVIQKGNFTDNLYLKNTFSGHHVKVRASTVYSLVEKGILTKDFKLI